ncbi:MAG: 50S ribosomal protein L24 [bacterium]
MIAGKDKFRVEGEKKIPFEGKVIRTFPAKDKVIVEGANIVTKHIKKQGTTPGQKVQFEKPIHVSNVMLVCPDTKKPTRIRVVQGAKTERISVKSGKKIG